MVKGDGHILFLGLEESKTRAHTFKTMQKGFIKDLSDNSFTQIVVCTYKICKLPEEAVKVGTITTS